MSEDSPRPRHLVVIVFVALAGCSAGPSGAPDGGTTSGADAGVNVARAETTGTIGPSGGTLALEGATLRVDGGSLGADVTVTLRRLSSAETPGAGQLVSAAWELLPAGLTFSELAMLELPLFGPAEGYGLAKWVDGGWAFVDGTGLPTAVPPAQSSGQLNGRTLSAPIAGFSRYAVVGRPTSETAPCACAQGATCDDGMCIELGCLRGLQGCPLGARVNVWSTRFFHVGCDGQRFNTACSASNVLAPAVVEVNGFAIDRDEVTVQLYVNAGCPGIDRDGGVACPPDRRAQLLCTIDGMQVPCPCNANMPGRNNYPMNCISYPEAEAFCRQAGGRLPTELEWEYAARGRVGGRYPWGNTPSTATCTEAVIRETMAGCGTGGPLPAGSREKDASPWGVRDMAGNLREWTTTWARTTDRIGPPTDNTHKIIRGGDWNTAGSAAQSFRRSFHPFDGYDARTGFRCVY